MEKVELKAWKREETGKGPCRRLRKAGFVPAVLYGPDIDNVNLKLRTVDIERALHNYRGGSLMLELDIEGEKKMAVFKVIDRHPVTDGLLHVDLQNVVKGHKITVDVPVNIVGKAEGVAKGGILQQEARKLKVECLPDNIPDSIDVDVTELDIGESIHVADLNLPESVRVLDDESLTIVLISEPTKEEAEAGEEGAEEEAQKEEEEKEE